jgi:large subunit ribosomal protein L5
MAAAKKQQEYTPRLETYYHEVIKAEMTKKFGYTNALQLPRLDKIVLNMGVGDAVTDRKHIENALADLSVIAGQKAVPTYAKKSIATFKVRDGMALGCKVTLRRERMYEFMDRLVHIALPRVRDFRGLSTRSFDGKGNFALGIKEHTIFQEVNLDKVTGQRGLDVIICTTASTDEEARALLDGFQMPFPKTTG